MTLHELLMYVNGCMYVKHKNVVHKINNLENAHTLPNTGLEIPTWSCSIFFRHLPKCDFQTQVL